MRVLEQRHRLEQLGAGAVAVGFSPADALAELVEHLGWPWPFLSDPDRVVYARLGLGRARLRHVYSPETLRIYRDAVRRGEAVRRPVEDARQLGGDAVVRHGRVVRLFRPTSPRRPSAHRGPHGRAGRGRPRPRRAVVATVGVAAW